VQDDELGDFVAQSDAEVAAIAAFLFEQGETAGFVATDRGANEGEDTPSGDDSDHRSLPSTCRRSATGTEISWLGSLSMDGCSCRHSGESLDMCHDVGIVPILLSTNVFRLTQRLDVLRFAVRKSTIQRVRLPPINYYRRVWASWAPFDL
jgi:hypothetical protein